MILLALRLLMLALAQDSSAPARSLETLRVYDGNWLFTPARKAGADSKIDKITNHCHMTDAFYTCEQVVNGKVAAMLVFVAGEKPGSYHTQAVMPDGHAAGRSDLTIDGGHWTYLSKDESGKPTFRVENVFKDRDHIHFEQFKADSADGWIKTGEGDEVRQP